MRFDFLYAGEFPGSPNPEIAKSRIRHLVEKGVLSFIDLTAPEDGMKPYEPALEELATETTFDLRRLSFPITDMGIPHSRGEMEKILSAIRDSHERGAVYIHCWGGIGRTGTVVGCWLRETGLSGKAALARVQRLYSDHMPKSARIPESPQTLEQRNFVLGWDPEHLS